MARSRNVGLGQTSRAPLADPTFRLATTDDLATCAAIWRISTNDYTNRLNQPEVPEDLAAVLRLYAHLISTDPDGFVVAERTDGTGQQRIVGFVSAVRRPPLWFLSMLFVLPELQGAGLGRALLDQVMPAAGTASLATCTDSLQPISNALYASLGMVPRMPLLRLVGLPDRPEALAELPDGVRAVRFDEIGGVTGDRLGGAALDDELAGIDREVAGFEHRKDHEQVRSEGRIGFLYLGSDGGPIGYGYASEAGRVGPVAVRDAALLDPILGHLVRAVNPRGAFGIWLPGAADTAMTSLLRSGFRIDGFPCLVCWDRPLIDFSRYVPISPGLL
jgi:GNAT superfamily N-acetyltransferase